MGILPSRLRREANAPIAKTVLPNFDRISNATASGGTPTTAIYNKTKLELWAARFAFSRHADVRNLALCECH
jgi:hypothetical protein